MKFTGFCKPGLAGLVTLLLLFSLSGCATIKLGPSFDKPIKEQVVAEGNQSNKILIININGILSDSPKVGLLAQAPSVLDSVVMQLRKAEKDAAIKAVVLKINSPGGGVTVSDILYHELMAFKARSKKVLYVQMMDVAASGGVYVAMAADHIQAHPSTITGSVGVISIGADLSGTMEKIGAKVNIYKTGANKDMGSPFRAPTKTDKEAFQEMVEQLAESFYEVVQKQRQPSSEQLELLKTARVFTGTAAVELGLVDSLGYLSDATDQACQLAEAKDCQVVTYRFATNANATAYSPSMQLPSAENGIQLLEVPMLEQLQLKSGMYYLYLQ